MTGVDKVYYDVAIQVLFFVVVILCAVTEVRENRVYNMVTYPTIFLGLGLNYLAKGVPGFKLSLMGAAVGFTIFLMFYLMKGIGPGDVKLVAALGALKAFPFILDVIVWTVIFGAVMAIFALGGVAAITLWTGAKAEVRALRSGKKASEGAAPPAPERKVPLIPYGVAICLGAVVTFVGRLPSVHLSWVNWQ